MTVGAERANFLFANVCDTSIYRDWRWEKAKFSTLSLALVMEAHGKLAALAVKQVAAMYLVWLSVYTYCLIR